MIDATPDPARVRAMFGRIASRYDLMNRVMTLGRDHAWRRATIQAVAPSHGGRALDLGCGTGDLTLALAAAGPRLTVGLDPVPAMLEGAQVKVAARAGIGLVQGDGLRLPFGDASFEVVVSGFVMRNIDNLPAALREQRRVLRPGGRIAILELTPMSFPVIGPLFRLYFHWVVPLIGGLVTGDRGAYAYLPASVDRFPDVRRLSAMLSIAGFTRVRYRRFMFGTVALHVAER